LNLGERGQSDLIGTVKGKKKEISSMRKTCGVLILMAAALGCKDRDADQKIAELQAQLGALQKKQQEAEAAAAAARAAQPARAAEGARKAGKLVVDNPTLFLIPSDLKYKLGGALTISNSYRLTSLSLLNKSEFPLNNLKGTVEFVDERNGESIATVPFSLKGSIAAGDTKGFGESDGTLNSNMIESGAPVKIKEIKFTHAEIVE
jgi:multidrug efflux pump subunit AcrA (membrane-fusion protein)